MTVTVPCMLLWMPHTYVKVPGVSKVVEKVAPVSRVVALEGAVVGHHRVRHAVAVGPRDLGARRDREVGGVEGEVGDADGEPPPAAAVVAATAWRRLVVVLLAPEHAQADA